MRAKEAIRATTAARATAVMSAALFRIAQSPDGHRDTNLAGATMAKAAHVALHHLRHTTYPPQEPRQSSWPPASASS